MFLFCFPGRREGSPYVLDTGSYRNSSGSSFTLIHIQKLGMCPNEQKNMVEMSTRILISYMYDIDYEIIWIKCIINIIFIYSTVNKHYFK